MRLFAPRWCAFGTRQRVLDTTRRLTFLTTPPLTKVYNHQYGGFKLARGLWLYKKSAVAGGVVVGLAQEREHVAFKRRDEELDIG